MMFAFSIEYDVGVVFSRTKEDYNNNSYISTQQLTDLEILTLIDIIEEKSDKSKYDRIAFKALIIEAEKRGIVSLIEESQVIKE